MGFISALHSRSKRGGGGPDADREDREADAEAEGERLAIPARDQKAPVRLDDVAHRVDGRDGVEPVALEKVARERARGEEEEHEHEREHALDLLGVPGPEADRHAERPERHRDHHCQREHHKDPEGPGCEAGAEGEADGEEDDALSDAEDQRPGELPRDQSRAVKRSQLKPVEETALDVLGDRLPRAHRREQRALHEGEAEREGEIGVGREAGQVRRRR